MNAIHLTAADRRMLGNLTTRDESGRHFSELVDMDWLFKMEDAGYVTIDRPVHAATGIPLGIDQWTLEVSPEVADWFGRDGRLRQEYED